MSSVTELSEEILTKLSSVDQEVLAEVVCQDQRNPAFIMMNWSVRRLSDKGVANPDGLFLFSGNGYDEVSTRPWSVVLKIVKDPGQEQDPQDMGYWKREILLIRSGLLETLPESIVRPRFYKVMEQNSEAWIWMEYIEDISGSWTLDDYAFAARQMGRFDGAYLTGTPLPDQSWLATDYAKRWIGQDNPDGAWSNEYIQQYFSAPLRARVKRLWEERDSFLHALQCLPQVVSHFDCTRLNLMIRRHDGQPDQLIGIDWAFFGCGAAGGSLYALVGNSPMFYVIDPSQVSDLDRAAYKSYLLGLKDAGWKGDPDFIRLGFCAWTGLWLGIGIPPTAAWWMTDEARPWLLKLFDQRSPESIIPGWATMCNYGLDRADEARLLMEKLRL